MSLKKLSDSVLAEAKEKLHIKLEETDKDGNLKPKSP
jgi:NADH:ubiquinone oxidoreductase subunit E